MNGLNGRKPVKMISGMSIEYGVKFDRLTLMWTWLLEQLRWCSRGAAIFDVAPRRR